MTHWSQAMRERTKEALLRAGTLAGGRVYAERLARLHTRKADQFPCVCVYVPSDEAERATDASPFDTTAELVIGIMATSAGEGQLTAEEAAAAQRDELREQVETALLGTGEWAASLSLERASRLRSRSVFYEGEVLIAATELTLRVDFEVDITPDEHGTRLAKVTLSNDNGPADGTLDTYDEIAIPVEDEE
jgi:hypothetical protein